MAAKINTKSPTIKRILKEAAELSNAPSPDYTAAPLEQDLFEWHFTLRGPPNSPYAQGIYHGRINLPPTYPLRPPSFRFTTPSGRFEANREICLSISGHHEETWQPAWGVRTAIVALRTFMETDSHGQLGGIDTSADTRRRLATDSTSWKCSTCNVTNQEIMRECEERYAAENPTQSEPQAEVDVPDELKLAFRDDLNRAKDDANAGEDPAEDAESAQLAEGFVQTVPEPSPAPAAPVVSAPPPAPVLTPARAALPQLARRAPVPGPASRMPPRVTTIHPARPVDPNLGVPPWLDYAIMSLAVLLVAMVLKVLMGYKA